VRQLERATQRRHRRHPIDDDAFPLHSTLESPHRVALSLSRRALSRRLAQPAILLKKI
jgi:hypothetical protein